MKHTLICSVITASLWPACLLAETPTTKPAATGPAPSTQSATPERKPEQPDVPSPKLAKSGDADTVWLKTHQNYVARAKTGGIDLLFVGDSITAGWRSHGELWENYFGEHKPENFGIGGDRTQHVLWRLQNGELDGISPKLVVLMIGTNNIGTDPKRVAEGITAIVDAIKAKLPKARILLLGVFPRGTSYHDGGRRFARDTNAIIQKLGDGKVVYYLDLTSSFIPPDGSFPESLSKDHLHLTEAGYIAWGDAVKATIDRLMKE